MVAVLKELKVLKIYPLKSRRNFLKNMKRSINYSLNTLRI